MEPLANKMSLPKMWDICTQIMWDQTYINSLDRLLKLNKVKSVLDAAGGTGFPSIALKKLGWDITYSDGNVNMYKYFLKKSRNENIQIPSYLSGWLNLSKTIPKKFDAVFCRGNSLIYIDSWEKNHISKQTPVRIKKTLKEFYKILKPGGLLYVDLMGRHEFAKSLYPITLKTGEKTIGNKKLCITWKIDHITNRKLRTWQMIFDIGDRHIKSPINYGYLLTHIKLANLLKEVGFTHIKEIKMPGKKNYAVFLAYKK